MSSLVDTTPPVVEDVTASPSQVKAGESITVYVDVKDDISGVSSVSIHGDMPSGKAGFGANIWNKTPEGVWYGTVAIPKYSEGGTWKINVSAHDNAGNSKYYRGIATFEIIPTDITPPEPPVLDHLTTLTIVNGISKGTIKDGTDGDFALSVKLDEGMNEITAKATDKAGNISSFSSPIFVLYQVHPLGNLPVIAIRGVGKVNTKRLEAHGVKTIKDMSLVDVFTLGKKTGISLFRLYMWRRKATLAMDVKIDRALFTNILKMRLGRIIAMPDDELSRKTNQPIEIISDLKMGISILLIALNNAIVKPMTLEKLAT